MGLLSKLGKALRKRRGTQRKKRQRYPEKVLAPVDEIVEQGVLLDNVAIRMGVKNSIIMNALKRNIDYRVDEIHDLVREAIEALVLEREDDAKHIARVRNEVKRYGRSAWQETEYGHDDAKTLKHRQDVYDGLASELRRLAADPEFISRTAEQARESAWSEIGDSLKDRATHPYYSGGASAEYQAARDERIEAFIHEDLTALIRQQTEGSDEPGVRFRRKRTPKTSE